MFETPQKNPEIAEEITLDIRPIWPGRPELDYKADYAEKETWLAPHPTAQPRNYQQQ
jgi:hypothetical protein